MSELVHHGFSESNEEAKHDDDPEDEDDDARNRLILFDVLDHVNLRLKTQCLKLRLSRNIPCLPKNVTLTAELFIRSGFLPFW